MNFSWKDYLLHKLHIARVPEVTDLQNGVEQVLFAFQNYKVSGELINLIRKLSQ
jgi:hypothetical protein